MLKVCIVARVTARNCDPSFTSLGLEVEYLVCVWVAGGVKKSEKRENYKTGPKFSTDFKTGQKQDYI